MKVMERGKERDSEGEREREIVKEREGGRGVLWDSEGKSEV